MKQCVNPEVGIMLTGYQLGMLDTEEVDRFDAHLKECECCRLELTQSNTAMSMLRNRRVDVLQALHSDGISFDSAKERLLATYHSKKSGQEEDRSNVKGFFKNLFKKNLSISNNESSGTLAMNWKWAFAPVVAIVFVIAVSMILFSHHTMNSEMLSSGRQIANQSNHPGSPTQTSDGIINKVFGFFKSMTSATSDSNIYSPDNKIQIPGNAEPSLTGIPQSNPSPNNTLPNGIQNPNLNDLPQRNSIQTTSPTADNDYAIRRLRSNTTSPSSSPNIPDSVEASKPGETIAASIASRISDVSDIAYKIKKMISERFDHSKDTAK